MKRNFLQTAADDILFPLDEDYKAYSTHIKHEEKTSDLGEEEILLKMVNYILRNEKVIEEHSIMMDKLAELSHHFFGRLARNTKGNTHTCKLTRKYRKREDESANMCVVTGNYTAAFSFLTEQENRTLFSLLFPVKSTYRAVAELSDDDNFEDIKDVYPTQQHRTFRLLDIAKKAKERIEAKRASRPRPPKLDYYDEAFRKLRHEVFLRDGEICANCGRKAGRGVFLHIDHIKPKSKFPELFYDINNLQVLCEDCNFKKTDKVLPYLDEGFWARI